MTLVRRYPEDDFAASARQTNSLAALAVTLLLVVAGLFLIQTLRAEAALQDCLVQGRTACLTTL